MVRRRGIGLLALASALGGVLVPSIGAEARQARAQVPVSRQAAAVTTHSLPFPCNQVWSGQTRTSHSPQLAIDLNYSGGDYGKAVVASAAGRVVHRGSMGGTSYGNLVVIRHADGSATYYAHLSAFSVSLNQSMSRGQRIGAVGGTGFPNTPGGFGSHLHYEQRSSYGGSSKAISFGGSRVYYYGTRNYTSRNCGGGGGSNPYTPERVCGSGYQVIDSAAISTKGRVYCSTRVAARTAS